MLGYDAVKDVSVSIIKLITASNPTYHCLHFKWKHYMNKSITTPKEPLTITKLRWFRRQLKSWASGDFRNFPWRKTQDPYAILVAEFLLQKTNADTVAPVYQIRNLMGLWGLGSHGQI